MTHLLAVMRFSKICVQVEYDQDVTFAKRFIDKAK